MAYTTQANVEAKVGTLSAEQITYLNTVLIPAIDAYINKETGTVFGSTESVEIYVSGNDSEMLNIPTMHDITEVSIVDGSTETTVPSVDYVAYPRSADDKYAIQSLSESWEEGFDNYKITGELGLKTVPADIKMIATEMAVNSLSMANNQNVKSESVGDWSVTYRENQQIISVESKSVLANYRRISRSI